MLGGTADIRAYDLYLSARRQLHRVSRGGSDPRKSVQKSLKQIQRAIDRDKKFALAWVLKSNAHDAAQVYFPEAVAYHRTKADEAAKRAAKLEPKLPQAHLELAFKAVGRLKWTKAEQEFEKARELGLSAEEMGQYAYLLVNAGHLRRARDLFLLSRASDPLNSNLFMYLIVTHDMLGDTKAALKFYDQGKALFPEWTAGDFNALVTLWGTGRRRDRKKAKSLAREIPGPVFAAVNGVYDSPRKVLKELHKLYGGPKGAGPINRMAIAACAAYFGDPLLALRALVDASKAVPLYAHKFWQPLFRDVLKLSGFKKFMRKGGFLKYWRAYGWPDRCRPDNSGFSVVG